MALLIPAKVMSGLGDLAMLIMQSGARESVRKKVAHGVSRGYPPNLDSSPCKGRKNRHLRGTANSYAPFGARDSSPNFSHGLRHGLPSFARVAGSRRAFAMRESIVPKSPEYEEPRSKCTT